MENKLPRAQDIPSQVTTTVGNFLKNAWETVSGLGQRAGAVLSDVQNNPNNYNIFAQALGGKLTDIQLPSGRNLNDLPKFAFDELTQRPQNYSIFNQAAEGNLTRNTLPVLQPLEKFVGEFGKNKIQTPAIGIAKGLYDTFRPDETRSLTDRAVSAGGAGLNALMLSPAGLAYNTVIEPTVRTSLEAINQLRKGDLDVQKLADRTSGKAFTGLGDALTDDPTLATVGNFAELPLTVFGPGGVKTALNKIKSQPLVNNLATKTNSSPLLQRAEEILKDYIDNTLKPSGKQGVMQGGLVKDADGNVIRRYGRQSMNPAWYRKAYSEKGGALANKDYKKIALDHLVNGSDEMGIKPNDEFIDLVKKIKSQPTVVKETKSLPMSQQSIADNIANGNVEQKINELTRNPVKRLFDSIFQPSKNTPEDFQNSLQEWRSSVLASKKRADVVASKFAGVDDNDGMKLLQYIESPNDTTASRVQLSPDQVKQYQPYMDSLRSHFDSVREEGLKRGLDIKYLNNYISHVWQQSPSQIVEKLRSLSNKPYFSKDRTIPTYEEGLSLGLTPKYTNPAQVAAHYSEALDRATANKQFSDYLEKSGYLVPSSKAPLDWKPVTSALFPKAVSKLDDTTVKEEFYSAPKNIAQVLNNVFDRNSNELLDLAGKVSGVYQNLSLSGGIPGTPINAYTVGQTIKEFTAGKVRAPAVALFHSFSTSSADDYFTKNASSIEDMAKEGINLSTTLSYADRFTNTLKNQLAGSTGQKGKAVIGKAYDTFGKYMDEPTFKRFMPILQVETYKQVYDRAVKSGKNLDEAKRLAGLTTKNFYGIVDEVVQGRNANVSSAMRAFLFAPKYRESMVNVWKNSLKSVDPRTYGDRSLDLNRRFLAGVALTYGIYDAVNFKLNGRHLWENPAGQEATLLIPTNKDSSVNGKTLGVPLLPSVAFLPRLALSIGNKTVQGDLSGATGDLTKLTSAALSPVGDVIRNEDYFGRPIAQEDSSPSEKYGQITRYLASRYILAHPWLQSFSKAGDEGMTPIETVSTALELPIRFYNRNSIETRLFFEPYNEVKPYADQYKKLMMNDPQAGQAYYEKNKEKIDEFKSLAPAIKIYYDLKDQGKTDEAAEVLSMFTEKNGSQVASASTKATGGIDAGGTFYYQNKDGYTKEFNTSSLDKDDTSIAGLEVMDQAKRDAVALIKESQSFRKDSSITNDEAKKLIEGRGLDYTDVAYEAIKTLSTESKARYSATVLTQASNKNDALIALIDEGILTDATIDSMVEQKLLAPTEGQYLKKANDVRKKARLGYGSSKKKAALPKIKAITLPKVKRVSIGKLKLRPLQINTAPIKAARLRSA